MKAIVAVLTVLVCATCGAAHAAQDNYPSRPIRLVSPFPPGGFNDILSRLIGQKLTESWGQQVVVDNRPGANMIIGTGVVAKAPPDGYTLVMAAIPHAINPGLYKLPYDPVKDFTPIVMICSVPNLLVVHPSVPVNSVKELLAYAKANPGKISFASVGSGSSSHMAGELLKITAGIDMVHVPYKGAAPALTDLVAGRVGLYVGATVSVLPHVRSGRLRALGVTSTKRIGSLSDLPTVIEGGLPGFEVSSWYGLLGPAGVPRGIVQKLNGEVKRIVEMPDVRERLLKDGADPAGSSPEEFGAMIRSDVQRWMRVVKATGAKVD
jgi:tripartite-type tricarboxylate transporter receptor subunit TctC